jgi:NitT/TauT family transport system permease protein
MKKKNGYSPVWYIAGLVFIFVLWELCSRMYASNLIFPGPIPVLKELLKLLQNERFFSSLGSTFLRVFVSMVVSVPLGLGCGIAAGLDKRAGAFFRPLFSLISATPVMPVILIAFLFLGSERTPIFTAFLMVFPVMTANTTEGIRRVDPLLIELFKVYQMSRQEALRYLYIPSIAPFILGGVKSSLSLSWKVMVAAEVLVQPFRSLGTGMQQAKAQLETSELFAWTLATVIAAAMLQGILGLVLRLLGKRGS